MKEVTISLLLTNEYLPNTTCFKSRKSHLLQVMKNWQPFVSLPLFACNRNVTQIGMSF